MIANLQPYPDYKESGQLWLGRVPRHWPVLPNRALFAEVKDRDHPDEEMLSVTITQGIVRQKALLGDSSKKDSSNLDKSAYKLVLPNDIAYNKMRAWQGALGASGLRGIISPAYVVMRLREECNLSRYFHHLYRTPHFAKEAERWSYGITSDMWSLRPEHFKMIYTPLPLPDEQAAIGRFLDYANGRLERAIRAKRKVIALLREQKQAIIHRAVARGLDPTVPLKPSGIPWLGDIPKHWEVTRVKLVSRKISKGDTPSNLGREFADGGPVRFIKIENIGEGEILEHPAHTIDLETHRLLKRSQLEENDIVYAIAGATTGKAAIVRAHHLPANTNQAVAFIRPNERILPSYLAMWLHGPGLKKAMWLLTVQSAQPNLSMEELGNLALVLPPKSEQSDIIKSLISGQRPLTTAIARVDREVELLREYRTRLVADVVTGKLDVREAARQLPAEPLAPGPTLVQEGLTEPETENPGL